MKYNMKNNALLIPFYKTKNESISNSKRKVFLRGRLLQGGSCLVYFPLLYLASFYDK